MSGDIQRQRDQWSSRIRKTANIIMIIGGVLGTYLLILHAMCESFYVSFPFVWVLTGLIPVTLLLVIISLSMKNTRFASILWFNAVIIDLFPLIVHTLHLITDWVDGKYYIGQGFKTVLQWSLLVEYYFFFLGLLLGILYLVSRKLRIPVSSETSEATEISTNVS